MDLVYLLLAGLAAYLIGSIPFGLIVTRAAGLGDIRQMGSGNIGATNVLRTGNKKLAALTLFLDAAKGTLVGAFGAILLLPCPGAMWGGTCGGLNIDDLVLPLGVIAVIGHMFPVWLKFKGGKGVATSFGMITAIAPLVGLFSLLTWVAVAVITRYSSLAALVASLVATLYLIIGFESAAGRYGAAIWILLALVWLRHRANIKRLLNGTEPKIGAKA